MTESSLLFELEMIMRFYIISHVMDEHSPRVHIANDP